MSAYKCTRGHDRCSEMYACKECPYCERVPKKGWVTNPSTGHKVYESKHPVRYAEIRAQQRALECV